MNRGDKKQLTDSIQIVLYCIHTVTEKVNRRIKIRLKNPNRAHAISNNTRDIIMNFGMGSSQPPPSQQHQHQQQQSDIDSSTPWMAAADGNIALLQESLTLLQLPVTAADEIGYTLLHAASSYGHVELMQWLITRLPRPNEDIHVVDQEGDTALHYASTVEACKILLMAGIDPGRQNLAGKTAMEAKQEELQDMIDDDDFEEDDIDALALRACIDYLQNPQVPS